MPSGRFNNDLRSIRPVVRSVGSPRRRVASAGLCVLAIVATQPLSVSPAFARSRPAVTITDPGPQRGLTGVAVSLAMAASGGSTPYSWSANGLPAGLAINASTGVIAGTPSTAGTYGATVTVTETTGNWWQQRSDSAWFTWSTQAPATTQRWVWRYRSVRSGHQTVCTPAPCHFVDTYDWQPYRVLVTAPMLRVYDNTVYTFDTLPESGAIPSNIVFEPAVMRLSGQAAGTELALPAHDAYVAHVLTRSANPGPIVLDFESLYPLRGTPAAAARAYAKLVTLLQWTREAAPGAVIGLYNQSGVTVPAYLALEQRLSAYVGAFFPSLYTRSADMVAWLARAEAVSINTRDINYQRPVYPYVWPEYYPGTPLAGQYVPGAQWGEQLRQLNARFPGVVIYGGSRYPESGDTGWIDATLPYLPQ